MRIESFAPIVNDKSSVLILGTMPSVTSLKLGEYYGHRDNIFWDLIFRICKPDWRCDELVDVAYTEKVKLVLENGIAIWDVLQFCERRGNLDRNIRNQIHNDFKNFFREYPSIKKVFFNGLEPAKYFEDFNGISEIFEGRTFKTLQSSSPSNSTNSFYILRQWGEILN